MVPGASAEAASQDHALTSTLSPHLTSRMPPHPPRKGGGGVAHRGARPGWRDERNAERAVRGLAMS
ncbi:hypothetical protein VE04_08591, partial [Pseudogymnoascus sp. 24MN13]